MCRSAGATAIVKTIEIPTMANGDFTYDGVKLVIWGTAEVTTSIMAASIPVLRVVVREIRTTAGAYYGNKYGTVNPVASQEGVATARTSDRTGRSTYRTNITGKGDGEVDFEAGNAIVSARAVSGGVEDDRSDKSILRTAQPSPVGQAVVPSAGRILQTNEIRLEYSRRRDDDNTYELGRVDRVN
jgi:hypothetical protein